MQEIIKELYNYAELRDDWYLASKLANLENQIKIEITQSKIDFYKELKSKKIFKKKLNK
jgi:hypothetical protein